jgi:hypothetical protein
MEESAKDIPLKFTMTATAKGRDELGTLFESPEKNCEFVGVDESEYKTISLFLRLSKKDPEIAKQCRDHLTLIEHRLELVRTAPPAYEIDSETNKPTWSVDGIPITYVGPYEMKCHHDHPGHESHPKCKLLHPQECTFVVPVPIAHCLKFFDDLAKDPKTDESFLQTGLPAFKRMMGFADLRPAPKCVPKKQSMHVSELQKFSIDFDGAMARKNRIDTPSIEEYH